MNLAIAKTIDCPRCHLPIEPNFTYNGPHIEMLCPNCNHHIKFVSMTEFTPEELEKLKKKKIAKPLF